MSNAFTCSHCGAPLTAPQDPQAMSMPCGYCRRESALPAHILQFRLQEAEMRRRDAAQAGAVQMQEQAQKRGSRLVMWIMILTIVPVLIGVAVPVIIAMTAVSAVNDIQFQIPQPPSPPRHEPVAAAVAEPPKAAVKPAKPPKDPAVVVARINALMKEKDKLGCTVTSAAQRLQGAGSGEVNIIAVGGCSNLLVVSSADDSKITLKISTPLGDTIPGPAPASEIDFRYCAPKVGPYPFTLEPESDAPYMISSLKCPKPPASAPAAVPPPTKRK